MYSLNVLALGLTTRHDGGIGGQGGVFLGIAMFGVAYSIQVGVKVPAVGSLPLIAQVLNGSFMSQTASRHGVEGAMTTSPPSGAVTATLEPTKCIHAPFNSPFDFRSVN